MNSVMHIQCNPLQMLSFSQRCNTMPAKLDERRAKWRRHGSATKKHSGTSARPATETGITSTSAGEVFPGTPKAGIECRCRQTQCSLQDRMTLLNTNNRHLLCCSAQQDTPSQASSPHPTAINRQHLTAHVEACPTCEVHNRALEVVR